LLSLRNALHLLFGLVALALCFDAGAAARSIRPDYDLFIREMVQKHDYDAALLRKLFAQVQTRSSILRAMSAPATRRPWYDFRSRIVTPSRIENGARFWLENMGALERASSEFGVAPELIVATIGIETFYGRNTGTFKVMDALATLAFDYPARAPFFRGELEEYLLLAREADLDAANTRGSYAGAIGIPQFMPSSYRKYAIDFDGDGRRDLVNSPADAIGSVGNYYRSFGWQTGGAVSLPLATSAIEVEPLIAAGLRPQATIAELRSRGLAIETDLDEQTPAAVFSVDTEKGPQLMLGFNNFYVITRYNRSVNYAMAVDELAREIKAVMGGAPLPETSAESAEPTP
jgi:membrane-bound lytic murein transglycosylase B